MAESTPLQELALVAFKLGAEMDDEVLGAVIQLHTGLAALKGVIDA